MTEPVISERLAEWIKAGELETVTTALLAASEHDRRALAAPLKALAVGWMPFPEFDDPGSGDDEMIAGRLRADPRTATLVPHVFSIPRVCGSLSEQGPAALAQLCADGDYDRQSLLDSCLLRLRAGDRPSAISAITVLTALPVRRPLSVPEPSGAEQPRCREGPAGRLVKADRPRERSDVRALGQ